MEEIIHEVQRGESLRDIAKHYGVSSTDIKRWNNLRRGKVKEGDKLTIKIYHHDLAGASTAPSVESTVTTRRSSTPDVAATRSDKSKSKAKKESKPKTTTYTVKSGDTLEKIARRFGTTVEAIQKANNMSRGTTRIGIGQKIKIPGKSSSKSKKKSSKKSSKKKSKKGKKRR